MGGGFSIAHGAQKVFNLEGSGKRCVGAMGDSTFFHSGMTSLLEAVYNRSNVLLTILDNRITGMTGHQENPGSGYTLQGEKTDSVDFEQLVRSLGVKNVRVINPLKLEESREAIKWGLSFDEPAVIITRWPCVLKKFSAEDKAEFGNERKVNTVDTTSCIGCRVCIKTGCPALEFHKNEKKVSIDSSQCVACDVCAQVCPKKAIIRRTV
jgi:indolepyruvate ferredoxin oxidoreductase alpha subunit